MHFLPVAASLAAMLVFGGACGPQRVRMHSQADVPSTDVATVVGPGSLLEYVMIQRVDGVEIDRDEFTSTEIEVLPGCHTFEVAWVKGSMLTGTMTQSTTNATVVLLAEAGRRYEIKAAHVKEGFWSEVGKTLVGGKGTWVAWIEDTATNRAVVGQCPTGAPTTSVQKP